MRPSLSHGAPHDEMSLKTSSRDSVGRGHFVTSSLWKNTSWSEINAVLFLRDVVVVDAFDRPRAAFLVPVSKRHAVLGRAGALRGAGELTSSDDFCRDNMSVNKPSVPSPTTTLHTQETNTRETETYERPAAVSGPCGCVRLCPAVSGRVWPCPAVSGRVRPCPAMSGPQPRGVHG